MAVLSVTVFTPSGAQTANAGLSVVTQQDAGTVSLVDATGKVTPYASKLQAPRGVATLPDGSVLVAEYGASRVVGLGGRFGTETTAIATVQTPDGLAVASDGSVYVTSLLGGELGRLDLERKTFARVSQGLKGPSQIAVRGDAVLVAESTGGDVVSVPRTGGGTKTVVAKGFQQPVGVAPTPDGGLLVADFAANKILKVDASGASADFVTIDQPVELALDPPAPAAGQAWSVVVASAQAGVVRFDQTGARVGNPVALPKAVGVATVAPGATAPTPPGTPAPSTTAVTPGSIAPGSTATTAPPTTPTTRATTTTSIPAPVQSDNSGVFAAIAALVVVLVLGGILAFFLARRRERAGAVEQASFDRPSAVDEDANAPVANAFGPCAAEEVEVAEAEGALKAVKEQHSSATTRVDDARTRLENARERERAALVDREAAEQTRREAAASEEKPEPPRPLKLEDLALTTPEGLQAFSDFRGGRIDAQVLEDRWLALGEMTALNAVRERGEAMARLDPTQPWPEERRAAEAEKAARSDALRAERELAEAQADIARFAERMHAGEDRVAAARKALEACQERQARIDAGEEAPAAATPVDADAPRLRKADPAPSSGDGLFAAAIEMIDDGDATEADEADETSDAGTVEPGTTAADDGPDGPSDGATDAGTEDEGPGDLPTRRGD